MTIFKKDKTPSVNLQALVLESQLGGRDKEKLDALVKKCYIDRNSKDIDTLKAMFKGLAHMYLSSKDDVETLRSSMEKSERGHARAVLHLNDLATLLHMELRRFFHPYDYRGAAFEVFNQVSDLIVRTNSKEADIDTRLAAIKAKEEALDKDMKILGIRTKAKRVRYKKARKYGKN